MKPRELFDVIVKAIGLVALLQGALALLDGLMIVNELANVSHSTPKFCAIRGAAQAFVGLCLLRGSWRIVDFAFAEETAAPPPEQADGPPARTEN
jgi:hypothetical protein